MADEEKMIRIPMDLASRLTGWHSSMYDPIYSISSCAIAGEKVYEVTFRRALANMESCRGQENTKENWQEVEEIVCAMKSLLGECEIRKTIIHAMARYFWSSAWADKVEDDEYEGDEKMYPGGEITHLAPDTSEGTVAFASKILSKFEEMNGKKIEEIFAAEVDFPDAYEYGGLIAGACLGHGIDGIGEYETPTVDSCEIDSRF